MQAGSVMCALFQGIFSDEYESATRMPTNQNTRSRENASPRTTIHHAPPMTEHQRQEFVHRP